jgi:hypothetical protein
MLWLIVGAGQSTIGHVNQWSKIVWLPTSDSNCVHVCPFFRRHRQKGRDGGTGTQDPTSRTYPQFTLDKLGMCIRMPEIQDSVTQSSGTVSC